MLPWSEEMNISPKKLGRDSQDLGNEQISNYMIYSHFLEIQNVEQHRIDGTRIVAEIYRDQASVYVPTQSSFGHPLYLGPPHMPSGLRPQCLLIKQTPGATRTTHASRSRLTYNPGG